MANPKWFERYPFASWGRKWSRAFLIGFLGIIVIITLLDSKFADFEYIRLVDHLLIAAYGAVWLFVYWRRPDLFKDTAAPEREFRRSRDSQIPQIMVDLADRRRIGLVALVVLALLTFSLTRFHNGWTYLVPSAIGPLLGSALPLWRPILLFPSLKSDDRLVVLLKSSRAKYLLLRNGVLMSMLLCFVMWIVASLQNESLGWSVDVQSIVSMTFLFALFSLTVHDHFLFRWALGQIKKS